MTLDDLLKLNDIASQNVVVVPGDELVVTVPDTQITVLTTKQLSYDEDYKAEVSYIDDNNNSRGLIQFLMRERQEKEWWLLMSHMLMAGKWQEILYVIKNIVRRMVN